MHLHAPGAVPSVASNALPPGVESVNLRVRRDVHLHAPGTIPLRPMRALLTHCFKCSQQSTRADCNKKYRMSIHHFAPCFVSTCRDTSRRREVAAVVPHPVTRTRQAPEQAGSAPPPSRVIPPEIPPPPAAIQCRTDFGTHPSRTSIPARESACGGLESSPLARLTVATKIDSCPRLRSPTQRAPANSAELRIVNGKSGDRKV